MVEFGDAVAGCGQTNHYLDTIRSGTDWFIKAHTAPNELWGQVGNGNVDHGYWGPPESMTMDRPAYKIDASKPGTELAMEAAAALASAAVVFKNRDAGYSSTLLRHARELFTFGDRYRGNYHNSIPDAANFYKSWSGYNDEMAWAASWLYRATGEAYYLNYAASTYDSAGLAGIAPGNSFDWDQKAAGVIVNLWKATGQEKYLRDAERWLNSWLRTGGMTYTPGGLAWLREWGPNRYAANSAFLASVIGSSTGLNFARSQINYMLGNNPQGRSYVVGVGPNSPKNPHHRAAHGSTTNDINNPSMNKHVLKGALVGGPGRNDDYVDSRSDYIKNEVACDYNAGFTGALAALAEAAGNTGSTPTTSPTTAPTTSPTTAPTTSPTTSPTTAPSSTTGTLKIEVHTGSSVWWLAIVPKNGAEETTKIQIKDSGKYTTWATMEKASWGAFTFSASQGAIQTPVSLLLTSASGKTLTLTNIITSIAVGVIDSKTQYGGSSTTTTPTTAPTTTPTTTPTTSPTTAPTISPTTAPTGTTIKVEVKGGSNVWWIGLNIKDAAVQTNSIEIKDKGLVSNWQLLDSSEWGFWSYQTQGGPLVFPLSVRLTATNGKQVTVNDVITSPNAGTTDTKVQFS